MTNSISNVKFSVITVVYNGEDYIEKTINSVIDQSYTNLEFIVVDGASTDKTTHIIRNYIKYIKTFISEKDKGIYDAMNKGLLNMTGDYVIFMNGGDCFYGTDVLYKINKELSRNIKYDFIYGDSYIQKGSRNVLLYKKARSYKYAWYGMFTNHQAMLYSAAIIRKHDLKYDSSYNISGDYKFTLQFLAYSRSVLYLKLPICIFLLGGISMKRRDEGFEECERARRETLELSKEKLLLIRTIKLLMRYMEDNLSGLYKYLVYS